MIITLFSVTTKKSLNVLLSAFNFLSNNSFGTKKVAGKLSVITEKGFASSAP